MVQLKPMGDRVLVLPSLNQETVKDGIIVIDNSKGKPVEGVVVAIGTKRTPMGDKLPFEVEVGTRVLVSRFGGTDVEFGDQAYVLVKEDDILGILT
jgi:chaperonin GroES